MSDTDNHWHLDKRVPILTAALQEVTALVEAQATEIESLKTRVATLEGAA